MNVEGNSGGIACGRVSGPRCSLRVSAVIASVVALLAARPRLAQAQTPLGSVLRVHALVDGEQDAPAVACDPAGDFIVVWTDHQSGIAGQRYSPDGIANGDTLSISPDVGEADVASDAAGNFTVVWDFGDDDAGSGIFLRRFDSEGQAAPAKQVNTTTAGSQVDPSLGCTGAGACIVVWDSLSTGVFGQRYDADGNKDGDEFPVEEDTSPQHFPEVAIDGDGNAVAVWNRFAAEPEDSTVQARYFPSAEVPGAPETVATTGNEFGTDPAGLSVAADAEATFTVVWNSGELGDPSFPTRPIPPDVFARRYEQGLEVAGMRIVVTEEPQRRQHHAAVAPLPGGGFVVVWENDSLIGGTGQNRVDNIAGQLYNASGAPLGATFIVNTEFDSDHRNPAVASDADGNFVVAWYAGDGSGRGVFARQYSSVVVEVTPTSTPTDTIPPAPTQTSTPTRTSVAPTSTPTTTGSPTRTPRPVTFSPTVTATSTKSAPSPTRIPPSPSATSSGSSSSSGCNLSPHGDAGGSAALVLLALAIVARAVRRVTE